MADQLFSLGVAILLSLVGSVIALRLKLHPIAGLLLLGLVAGPGILGIVQQSELITFLAEVGAILLIFGIGLEVDPHTMLNKGLRAIVVAVLKLAIVFTIVYETSLLMGLGLMESLLLGSMLSVTSTAIYAMMSKGVSNEKDLLVTVLIIEDIFSIFVLAMIPGLGHVDAGQLGALFSMAVSFLILVGGYLAAREVLKLAMPIFIESGNKESILYASLALCFILSFGAEAVGLAAAIGAFLAGNVMASLRGQEEVYATLKPFTSIFSSFFFLSVGMSLNPQWIMANPVEIAVFSLVCIFGKYFGTASAMYFMGVESTAALGAGALMLSTGEFSLLIAKEAAAYGMDMTSLVGAIVFITAIVSSVSINNMTLISSSIEKLIPANSKMAMRRVSRYMSQVAGAFEPGGTFHNVFVKELGRVGTSVMNVVIYVAFALFLLRVGELGIATEYAIWIEVLAAVLALAGIAYEAPKFFKSAIQITHGISKAFLHAEAPYEDLDQKMMTRSVAVVLLLVASVGLAFVFSLLMLPRVFFYFLFVFYILAGVFFVETIMTAGEIFKRKLKEKVHKEGRGAGGLKTMLINFILD
ncbi:cation:proton antiporter [Candidatus Micrarchaeota archaeon]|nr:cation:proton antiporter [Candidatus Micrarchaeota archaeon]